MEAALASRVTEEECGKAKWVNKKFCREWVQIRASLAKLVCQITSFAAQETVETIKCLFDSTMVFPPETLESSSYWITSK